MIPRKWEWVKYQCVRRGFEDAAKLAGEIDAVLLDCYDMEHTMDWEVFLRTFDFGALAQHKVFMDIVTESVFCVACMDREYCKKCLFAKMTGDCGDPASLYRRFLAEIYKVWSKEERE